MYTHEDITIPITMHCRTASSKSIKFENSLGFSQYDIILTEEQSVITKLTLLFFGEKIILQHSVPEYKIDLYFPEHNLEIEIEEKNHIDRNKTEEERERKIKEYLNCGFIRINLDIEGYDEYSEFSRIQNYINNSSKNLAEKSLIERISKWLLEMKFIENNSITSKVLRHINDNVLPALQKISL